MDEFWELFRNPLLFIYAVVIIPASCLTPLKDSVNVQIDFKAYRLQHFDLASNQYGSRAWKVLFEAASMDSKQLVRRCVLLGWRDLVTKLKDFSLIFDNSVGAVLIIVPADLDELAANRDDFLAFVELEAKLISNSYELPVYLVPTTEALREVAYAVESASQSQRGSAFSAILHAISANVYQIVSSNQASTVPAEQTLYNIVGKLLASERGSEVPSIAVVAHYDSFGAAPSLSFGADSNGSGVAVLLELFRILRRYYQTAKTRPRFDLTFALTAAGKLNYQGARQLAEQFSESSARKPQFIVCLDSLAGSSTESMVDQQSTSSSLSMHVSKKPTFGGPIHRFFAALQTATAAHNSVRQFGKNQSVGQIQKKIRLNADYLSWEHEAFNVRRLMAFTLSRRQNYDSNLRRSMLDTRKALDVETLERNAAVIAEALIRFLYDLPSLPSTDTPETDPDLGPSNARSPVDEASQLAFLDPEQSVQRASLENWLDFLAKQARSAQLLAADGPNNALVGDLHALFDHFGHEAALAPISVDKKNRA